MHWIVRKYCQNKEFPWKSLIENHSIIGGLGSAVAEVLAENNISVKFKRHGVKERFGAVGTPEFLQKEFRLTAEDLLQTVENTLK